MKKMSSRLMVLAVAGTVFAAGFGASAVLAAYSGNSHAMHAGSAAVTNSECVGCHGQKALEVSLDPFTFTAHKRHLYSAFLRFQSMGDGCATCHPSTDVWEGSGAVIGKQVDPAFCVTCHGGFNASAHGDADLAAINPRGCTTCHTAPAALHADVDYVNKMYTRGRAYCTKCHGGLDFYAVEETRN